MENNFKYFNAFFIIATLIILIGLFKYFFYENQEKNQFNNFQKKYLNKNYIDHILFIPDNFYFLQTKKIDNSNNEYHLLLKKLFSIIQEALKYNIRTISINLINLTDLSLMNITDIKKLINNKKLWKLIEKYAKKMNIKVNFIYDNTTVNKELSNIFEDLKQKTNNKKYQTEINFIFGYDLFNDIKIKFTEIVNNSKSTNDLLLTLNNINMEKLLLNKIPAIDLVIVFDNTSINDNLLLHMRNCKIVNLNYSLDKITKKNIHLILKEFLINVHPFL